MQPFLSSWRSYFLLASGCFFSIWLSLLLNVSWLLPVLMTLLIYPLFVADLVAGKRELALRHVLWWAFVSSVLTIFFTRTDPAAVGNLVIRGVGYRDEMFRWILTGQGPEGNIRLFVPIHLKHFLAFAVVALLTGGLCGLAFGAILINYMNFYVGSLSLKMHHPLWAYLFGWPIWSLIRVVGFILCGIALAQPLLSLIFRFERDWRVVFRWLGMGILLGLLDIGLKWALAPFWRELLRRGVTL